MLSTSSSLLYAGINEQRELQSYNTARGKNMTCGGHCDIVGGEAAATDSVGPDA